MSLLLDVWLEQNARFRPIYGSLRRSVMIDLGGFGCFSFATIDHHTAWSKEYTTAWLNGWSLITSRSSNIPALPKYVISVFSYTNTSWVRHPPPPPPHHNENYSLTCHWKDEPFSYAEQYFLLPFFLFLLSLHNLAIFLFLSVIFCVGFLLFVYPASSVLTDFSLWPVSMTQ